MVNLKEETINVLKIHGKTLSDIIWFGNDKVELTGSLELALDFDYYEKYGTQEVLVDLILVGNDFWLERHEYDGSEWWEYKTYPERPEMKTLLGSRILGITGRIRYILNDEYSDEFSLIKRAEFETGEVN